MNSKTRHLLETEIMTTQELAEYLGVTKSAIQQRVHRNKIECVKKSKNVMLFDRRDFTDPS